ncbi:hypothetical protein ACFV01_08600, partial [Streptomyces sp. NPDC059616]
LGRDTGSDHCPPPQPRGPPGPGLRGGGRAASGAPGNGFRMSGSPRPPYGRAPDAVAAIRADH